MGIKHYVPIDRERDGTGYRSGWSAEWPLPKDEIPGEWHNVGDDPSSFVTLFTLKGLLYSRALCQNLYRTESRGYPVLLRGLYTRLR